MVPARRSTRKSSIKVAPKSNVKDEQLMKAPAKPRSRGVQKAKVPVKKESEEPKSDGTTKRGPPTNPTYSNTAKRQRTMLASDESTKMSDDSSIVKTNFEALFSGPLTFKGQVRPNALMLLHNQAKPNRENSSSTSY